MERRELLGLLGAGAVGFVSTAGVRASALAQEEKEKHLNPKHDEHLKVMVACIRACNETAHHCLVLLASDKTEHREYHAKVHSLTMDCQAICALTATLMARDSLVAKPMHQACAEACDACATECEKSQDEIKKDCGSKCRECANACRECCKVET